MKILTPREERRKTACRQLYPWAIRDSSLWKGGVLGFAGIAAISTDSLFARLAEVDGFVVTFWVGLLTAVVMLTVTSRGFRRSVLPSRRSDLFSFALAATLQASSMICFVLALKHTYTSNVVAIVASAPLFAAIMAWMWLHEATGLRVRLAMSCTAVGIAVIVGDSVGSPQIVGDLLAVVSVACFAAGLVLLRKHSSLNASAVVGWGGIGMILLSCGAAEVPTISARTWFSLLAMGAVFGPLGRWMLTEAPKHLASAQVALFAPLETVLASLWAFLVFGEAPTSAVWLGGGIVVLGVCWGFSPPITGLLGIRFSREEMSNFPSGNYSILLESDRKRPQADIEIYSSAIRNAKERRNR